MQDNGESDTAALLRRQTRIRRRFIFALAVAAAFGVGCLLADFDNRAVNGLVRVGTIVALVLLYEEIRLGRGLARLERQLQIGLRGVGYVEGYVDGIQRRPPDDGRHLRSV